MLARTGARVHDLATSWRREGGCTSWEPVWPGVGGGHLACAQGQGSSQRGKQGRECRAYRTGGASRVRAPAYSAIGAARLKPGKPPLSGALSGAIVEVVVVLAHAALAFHDRGCTSGNVPRPVRPGVLSGAGHLARAQGQGSRQRGRHLRERGGGTSCHARTRP
jgi:hypothetical protein